MRSGVSGSAESGAGKSRRSFGVLAHACAEGAGDGDQNDNFPVVPLYGLEGCTKVGGSAHAETMEALRQFLLSVRSLCSVWSVRDAERAFLASSFMKKSFDVAEWKSLLLGPSLSKHPAWSEVFREFEMPQHKWMQYDVPPDELSDAVTAMELLFEHRVESSGMDGAIDFTKEIKFEEFERWLLARGMILEDCGVCPLALLRERFTTFLRPCAAIFSLFPSEASTSTSSV